MLFTLLLACSPPNTRVLRFTAIPDQDTTLLAQRYAPVAQYLSKSLGVSVEYVPAADYSASVEMFKNGDIQLAWFGGLTGVQARAAVPGARAIAQGVEDPRFHSYFIAHVGTGIEPSNDFPVALGALPFTFGSVASTSGRLMPEFFIRQHTGASLEAFFTQGHAFSGSHDKTAKLVESGRVKAGAISYTAYDSLVQDGTIDPSVCRVIWTTPDYPDYNFTAHPSLRAEFGDTFIDTLRTTLIEMRDPELLSAFSRSGFIPAKNEDFERVEQVARSLGFTR